MNLLNIVRDRFAVALTGIVSDITPVLEMIRPAQDPKFGDFKTSGLEETVKSGVNKITLTVERASPK